MDGGSESQLKREGLNLRGGFSNVLIGIFVAVNFVAVNFVSGL